MRAVVRVSKLTGKHGAQRGAPFFYRWVEENANAERKERIYMNASRKSQKMRIMKLRLVKQI